MVTTAGDELGLADVSLVGGKTVALWRLSRAMEVYFSELSSGGWLAPVLIANSSVSNLSLAASSSGGLTVLWTSDHAFARSWFNGSWEAAVQVDRSAELAPLQNNSPTKKMLYMNSGSLLGIWSTQNSIWQSVRPVGQPWGPSSIVGTDAQPMKDWNLAVGGRRAVATWFASDLVANEYNEASGWGMAKTIDTLSTAIKYPVTVYDSVTNSFVAIWIQDNAAGSADLLSSSYR